MVRTAREPTPPPTNGGEYQKPNAKLAIEIYRTQVLPKKSVIAEKTGDLSDPYAQIKDQCHFPRAILDMLFRLEAMEDAKRDHNLLALHEGLSAMNFAVPHDLVARAQGKAPDEAVVPAAKRKPVLAAVENLPVSDGLETDLAAAADAENEPGYGSGAAAMAAMKAIPGENTSTD